MVNILLGEKWRQLDFYIFNLPRVLSYPLQDVHWWWGCFNLTEWSAVSLECSNMQKVEREIEGFTTEGSILSPLVWSVEGCRKMCYKAHATWAVIYYYTVALTAPCHPKATMQCQQEVKLSLAGIVGILDGAGGISWAGRVRVGWDWWWALLLILISAYGHVALHRDSHLSAG